jgi:branched-chain amino acid transport system permease protein
VTWRGSTRLLLAAVAATVGLIATISYLQSNYIFRVATNLAMWIALSESWIVLSGMTGYVSLGHVVFFGLGGYILAMTWGTLPLWSSLLLSAVSAALLAWGLGYACLRVRGPYFVILTFGIAEFVKFVVIDVEAYLGKFGRLVIGAPDVEWIFLMMSGLALLAFLLAYFIRGSRLGAGFLAIREDEAAARTIGIPVTRFKVVAFVLSAILPSVAGALFLLESGYFEPMQASDPVISLTMITMSIIGGSDRATGPLLGAVFLVVLSELLWSRAPQLYMLLLGTLLVIFVLKAPNGVEGLISAARRKVFQK